MESNIIAHDNWIPSMAGKPSIWAFVITFTGQILSEFKLVLNWNLLCGYIEPGTALSKISHISTFFSGLLLLPA